MNSIGGVLVALIVLGGISYWNGHCFTVLFKKKEDIVFQILIGAVVFLAVFVIVELPMEKAGTSFHALVIVECAVYAVLLAVEFVICRHSRNITVWRDRKRWEKLEVTKVIFLVLMLFSVLYGMNNGIRINGYDTSYYTGHAATTLYTDTMYQYSARSGEYIGVEMYVHDGYPIFIAFLSKIFFMHPLVVTNRLLACAEILLVDLIVYETAYRLAGENHRIAVGTVLVYLTMSIFCYQADEGRNFFLWQRTAESKSMLANIYLPLILLALILLSRESEELYNWFIMGLVLLVGNALSISGIFLMTAMAGSGFLALLFYKRKLCYIGRMVSCMIPGLLVGVIRLFL